MPLCEGRRGRTQAELRYVLLRGFADRPSGGIGVLVPPAALPGLRIASPARGWADRSLCGLPTFRTSGHPLLVVGWNTSSGSWDLSQAVRASRWLRGSTARVCLMDSDHYQAYVDGDEYEYHGGFTDVSPVILEVPYDDYWYLVVDSNSRRIRAEVSQVFD
ncbi:DUF1883 domain-containing protein [Actinophytocola algeriensis]|nr:DUF1883 domain-containing protein [Actinophytocola algeriensis]